VPAGFEMLFFYVPLLGTEKNPVCNVPQTFVRGTLRRAEVLRVDGISDS
jgi:hypothetical protein